MDSLSVFGTPENISPDSVCVYRIAHSATKKAYIGSSVNIQRRFWAHKNDLARKKHHCKTLQKDWDKFGQDCFVFEVLEIIDNDEDRFLREQYWINRHGCARSSTCYNSRDVLPYHSWPEGWFEETLEASIKKYLPA